MRPRPSVFRKGSAPAVKAGLQSLPKTYSVAVEGAEASFAASAKAVVATGAGAGAGFASLAARLALVAAAGAAAFFTAGFGAAAFGAGAAAFAAGFAFAAALGFAAAVRLGTAGLVERCGAGDAATEEVDDDDRSTSLKLDKGQPLGILPIDCIDDITCCRAFC